MGLSEKTSAETLQSAFEEAVSARLVPNKKNVSQRLVVRSCLFTVLNRVHHSHLDVLYILFSSGSAL